MAKKSNTIIRYPLSTEKSLRLMESENKLIFIVSLDSKKQEIKKAIEEMFNVKVEKVNTLVDNKGRKRAYIKFNSETPAIDVATNMGIM
ncbi:MAG: 50S ribosomal protein L23 [Candidatus Woesearchaeota archaeon]